MTKAPRSLLLGFAVVLAAIAASTAVAVFSVSAQTNDLTIEFADNATGDPIDHVVLPDLFDTIDVQLRVSGLAAPNVNLAQVSITHDPSQVAISHSCKGLFDGGGEWSGRINDPDNNGDESDGFSWFLCGLFADSLGSVESGQIMGLTITRLVPGDPITIEFNNQDPLPTRLFEPGVEHIFDVKAPLDIFETSPPEPTAVPTQQPTAVPTTSGGGGGGGGAPPPAPTPTPSGPILTAPEPPLNVTVVPVADGARLSWQAPTDDGGSEVTSYRLLVIPSGQIVNVPAEQTEFTVTGLDPAVSYQFQINAVNSVGTGQSAGLTAAVTPLQGPGQPQTVAASLGTNGLSAIVSWQVPLTEGSSPITGYVVTSDPSSGADLNVLPDQLSATVTGLSAATAYRFRVRAENADGQGPLSDLSNEIITASVTGSPGDSPNIESTTPSVEGDVSQRSEFEAAVSGAFDEGITIDSSDPSITAVEDGLVIEFPATSTGGSSAPGSLSSMLGNLAVDVENGVGTATLVVDDSISITGAAEIGTATGKFQIQINDPMLEFSPPDPTNIDGGGGLVSEAGAEFNVSLSSLPGAIGLSAQFFSDVSEVPEASTSFQLAAGGSGGEIEDPASDVAFVVVVSKLDITNDDLGDNAVALTVSRAWYDDRLAAGKEIFITKVGDDGVPYAEPATCEIVGDSVRCRVVFTGAAGGFSLFGLVALTRNGSNVQATPTPTPAAVLTSTPTPAPQSGAVTLPPTPTATTGPSASPVPTATPLGIVEPTPGAQATAVPVQLEPGDDGIPAWAVWLIVIGGIAVVAPAAGGAYTILRRNRHG